MNPPDPLESRDQRLTRLLAVKRYELPPPGFFDRLPARILVSLRAGCEVAELPWWERAWTALVREPMVACSYAALGLGASAFGVSVLLTALEGPPPPSTVTLGSLTAADHSTALPVNLPSGGSLAPGVIYRVHPSGPSVWQSSLTLPAPSPDAWSEADRAAVIPILVSQPR